MELARADWIREAAETDDGGFGLRTATWAPHVSPLRRLWSRFFRALSRLAYAQAGRIVTLSRGEPAQADRRRRARRPRSRSSPTASSCPRRAGAGRGQRRRRAGRGDGVIALPRRRRCGSGSSAGWCRSRTSSPSSAPAIWRCARVELDVRVIGPMDEDAGYATRCRDLVARLGRGDADRFVGPMPPAAIYGDLDVVVLTSFSEGQPLVILEAYACGVPVIATDVGACREMIEGRAADDRAIGPSGFVTRVATPKETAAALVRLARDSELRRRMGAGRAAAGGRLLPAARHAGRVPRALRRAGRRSGDRGRAVERGAPSTADGSGDLRVPEVNMAGIGWKLQRMIDRGSLAGTIGAYLTGVAVTSAPPGCSRRRCSPACASSPATAAATSRSSSGS